MRQGCCNLRHVWIFSLAASVLMAGDPWAVRLAPAMNAEERKRYASLTSEEERAAFRESFWRDKAISEASYLERVNYADHAFGSGQLGSGGNTDQGRMYLANGAPNSIHRLPSSRVFHECEVWYYDSLPGTGYRSRLQFLFYRRNGIGDFKLFSPQLHTIRALLVPQSTTRGMFPVNDVITPNDIRARLKTSPAEEEIIEAAVGVARGVTGSENGTILAKAMSVSTMLRAGERSGEAVVESRLNTGAPEIRVIQYWVDREIPVTDVQVRARGAASIAVRVSRAGEMVEQSAVPLSFPEPKTVVFTQRFFLLPGDYQLLVDVDGLKTNRLIHVQEVSATILGEAFEERVGEVRISMTPDPRGPMAREVLARGK
jgi:GWxTD domain-containing protein